MFAFGGHSVLLESRRAAMLAYRTNERCFCCGCYGYVAALELKLRQCPYLLLMQWKRHDLT